MYEGAIPRTAWGKGGAAAPVAFGEGVYGKYGTGLWTKGPWSGLPGWGGAWWAPTPGGGFAKQYPPGQVGIPYAWYPGYGLVQ
ncbi:MAG TPA: hypothetical protein VD902_07765 [Symbiobacteriaceae bacterium]|nr:hypothetical protein [Symbiobacteriaceae bacterium]